MINSNITYTWEQLHADTKKICKWVDDLGFKPDYIVGVVRGGAIPAIIASHHFKVPVELLKWSTRDHIKADYALVEQISRHATMLNKKILFIEDIVDSGKTMLEIKQRIGVTHNNNILFTSLWYNPSQPATIHYWCNSIDRNIDNRWIIFPYE